MGFPLLVLNTTYNFHILIGNNTIKVYYKGILTNLTSFTSYFNGSYCLAATYHTFTKTTQTDQISFAVKFILSLSNSSVFSAWVTLNFLFNYTSNDFDLHSNIFTPTQMYTFSSPITLVLISRFILLMQSNSTGNTAIYDLNMGMAGTTVGIPQNQIFKLLSYSNIFYILESKGLIKLIYNPSTVTLSSDIVVSILP